MRDFLHIAIKIERIADRQYGHVTRQQLLELEVPSQTIVNWARTRRLIRVHAGVYAVGHQQHTGIARAAAAVLACGPGAVLSHDSAAALWSVREWPRLPETTTALHRRRKGIRSHRTATLATRDVRKHRNIRVTSPARTVLDIQPRLTDAQLIRAVNDLRLAKHMRPTELQRLLQASSRAQALIDPSQNATRSPMEDRFLAFCTEHHLPTPILNAQLLGFEVDALFPEEMVIVELDSWTHHREHATFESDRKRDAVAGEHGFLTVRITWDRLTRCEDEEAARLHRTLERRRRQQNGGS